MDADIDIIQPVKKLTTQEAMRYCDQQEFLEDVYKDPPSVGRLVVRWMLLWMPWSVPGR